MSEPRAMTEPAAYIEKLILAHHSETNRRLKRIEDLLDGGHSHRENPSWAVLAPILAAIVGAFLVVG